MPISYSCACTKILAFDTLCRTESQSLTALYLSSLVSFSVCQNVRFRYFHRLAFSDCASWFSAWVLPPFLELAFIWPVRRLSAMVITPGNSWDSFCWPIPGHRSHNSCDQRFSALVEARSSCEDSFRSGCLRDCRPGRYWYWESIGDHILHKTRNPTRSFTLWYCCWR